jgi:hypothetical protein
MGHYASQCLENEEIQAAVETICRECRSFNKADELTSKLETTFSMVLCLSKCIGGGLLSGCLTSIVCLHYILPWRMGDLQTTCDILQDGHVEIGCLLERMPYVGGGTFGILEEGVGP